MISNITASNIKVLTITYIGIISGASITIPDLKGRRRDDCGFMTGL